MKAEIEEGNIEYKRKLSSSNYNRYTSLITQMKWRIDEGHGEAHYYLGLNDDGTIYTFVNDEENETIEAFLYIINKANIKLTKLKKINDNDKYYYHALIHYNNVLKDEKKIMIIGDEQSGKTSFLSYLMYNEQDNGNGYLRNKILNHDHELISGKTSSLTVKSIGYDGTKLVNFKKCKSLMEIKNESSLILTFFDVPINYTNLINYMDHVIIIKTNNNINNYINLVNDYSISYTVVNNNKTLFTPLNNNLWREIPFKKYIHKSVLVLNIISCNQNKYLMSCLNLNNILQSDVNIIFDNGVKAYLKTIRYFDKYIPLVDKNIIFTALIESEINLKKYKEKFFYSL